MGDVRSFDTYFLNLGWWEDSYEHPSLSWINVHSTPFVYIGDNVIVDRRLDVKFHNREKISFPTTRRTFG